MTKPTNWPVHPAKTRIILGIRPVFAVRMKKPWVLSYPLSAHPRLIRLGCPGWSESLLGAQVILLVLSCGGSWAFQYETGCGSPPDWGIIIRQTVLKINFFPISIVLVKFEANQYWPKLEFWNQYPLCWRPDSGIMYIMFRYQLTELPDAESVWILAIHCTIFKINWH